MMELTSTVDKIKGILRRMYCEHRYNLNALSIYNCDGNGPCHFSKASIYYDKNELLAVKFPSWYYDGLRCVANHFAEETCENLSLRNVFRGLSNHLDCLKSLFGENVTEETVRNILALHYFKPLVSDCQFIVDRGSDICEFCKEKVPIGDTYLGHPDVWHGRADIVIKNSVVKVHLEQSENTDDELENDGPPSKQARIEDDATYFRTIEENLEKIQQVNMQVLAEGIVNAFCEARKDQSLFNKFIPSFLATEKHIRIILYNCQLDILLFSEEFEIWNKGDTLNIGTLLSVWLALNFDQYLMEVEKEILDLTPRATFERVVGDKYDIYLTKVSKEYIVTSGGKELKTPTHEETNVCMVTIPNIHARQLGELMELMDNTN